MKRITLIRHAKSSWSNPALSDHDRPLSDRGMRDAPRMFTRLGEHIDTPDLVISSDAERAAATATALIRTLDYPRSRLRLEPRLYMASPQNVLEIITEQADEIKSLMLVGHNPTFTVLAVRLASSLSLDNLPTCGIVGLSFDCDSFGDIPTTDGEVVYFDYPKNPKLPLTSGAQ